MKIRALTGRLAAVLLMAVFLVCLPGLAGLGKAAAQSGQEGPGETKVHFSEMFYLAPTAYLILDSQGRVTESNTTAANMLGVNWPTLLASSLGHFVAPESRSMFEDHFRAARREVCKQVVELDLTRPDGAMVRVRLESICAFDKQGNPVGFRVAMVNLSPIPGLAGSARHKLG